MASNILSHLFVDCLLIYFEDVCETFGVGNIFIINQRSIRAQTGCVLLTAGSRVAGRVLWLQGGAGAATCSATVRPDPPPSPRRPSDLRDQHTHS